MKFSLPVALVLLLSPFSQGAVTASVSSEILRVDPAAAAAWLRSLPTDASSFDWIRSSSSWTPENLWQGSETGGGIPLPILGHVSWNESEANLSILGSGAVPSSAIVIFNRGGRSGGEELHSILAEDFVAVPPDSSNPGGQSHYSYSGTFELPRGISRSLGRYGMTLHVTRVDGSTMEIPMNFTAIPEPGVLALVPAALMLSIRRRRS